MKGTLWKLTALAGVMAAGFLVVYQAQTNLTHRSSTENPRDIEQFRAPGEPQSPEPQPTLADETSLSAGSGVDADRSVPAAPVPPGPMSEPGRQRQPEPPPTLAAEDRDDPFNPFADDAASTPSEEPTETMSGERSRFAELVASFSDRDSSEDESAAADDPTDHSQETSGTGPFDTLPVEVRSRTDEPAAPVAASPASLNPFASASDASDPPAAAGAPEPDESATNPFAAQAASTTLRDDQGVNPFSIDDRSPSGLREDPAEIAPDLAAAPSETVSDQEWEAEESVSAEPIGTTRVVETGPSLAAPDPPQAQRSGNTYFPKSEVASDIAQASHAELAVTGPSSVEVLPGEDRSAPELIGPGREPERSTTTANGQLPAEPALLFPASPESSVPVNGVPSKALDSGAPRTQTEPATEDNPFGAEPESPPKGFRSNERHVTDDVNPFGASPATQRDRDGLAVERPDHVNPFGASPATQPARQPERAAPEAFPPAPAETSAPPKHVLPESPRPLPARPDASVASPTESSVQNVRPTPPDAEPVLKPEDLRGVGTISGDSPIGTQQAQVTIEKEAPTDAVIGKPLIYSIHVRNIGRNAAENVVVKDVTPRGSRLVGTSPQAELDESSGKLIWRLGRMSAGELRTIKVKVIPTHAGQIGSIATVSFEAAVAARTVITAPELRVSIDGPEEVGVGEQAVFRFTLTNTGSADASGAFLRNLIPEGFEHPRGGDLEYDVGVLRRGQSREVELTLQAVKPGQYENRVILAADGDLSVNAVRAVSVLASRLSVHREGPADRFVGRSARFTNTVTNESSTMLPEVTLIETVPAGVRFEEASEGGVYDPQRRTVTWRLRQLEPGDSRSVHVSVVPTEAARHEIIVKAFDSRGQAAEVTSPLRVAGFSSLKVDVAHEGVPVPIGDEVALRLTVKNRGTAPAKQVRTLVEIPPEMRFVDARGPVRYRLVGSSLVEFEPLNSLEIDGEQHFELLLTAVEKGDARVRVELQAAELSSPLNQEELVVIHPNQE